MVRLMHRPDPFDRKDPRGGEADIILGKHRSGPTAEFCHWRTVSCPSARTSSGLFATERR